MKKIDTFICGIASVFTYSDNVSANVLKKYPSSYEKNVEKSLQDSWLTVGEAMRGAIIKYGTENKKND